MNISDKILSNAERLTFSLRELYSQSGYQPYRMSKFEDYDLYSRNKDFLVSDSVITFTDIGGKQAQSPEARRHPVHHQEPFGRRDDEAVL